MAEQLRIAASNEGNVVKLGDEPRQRPIYWTRDRVERDTAQLLRRRQLIEDRTALLAARAIEFPRLLKANEAAWQEYMADPSKAAQRRWDAAVHERQAASTRFTLADDRIVAELRKGRSPRLAEMHETLMDELAALTGRYGRPGVTKARGPVEVSERSSARTMDDIVHGRTIMAVRERTNYWSIHERSNAITLAIRELDDLALEADQSDDALRPKLERLWAEIPAVSSELRYREQRP